MRFAKRLTGAVAAGILATAGLTAMAPSAQAATGWDRCPHGSMCTFSENNGQGSIAIFQFGSPDLRQQGMDNHVGSFWNRSGKWMKLWDGYNYTGDNLGSAPAYTGPINQAGIAPVSSVSGQ
ncbi:peptidase inhibitor family I36 protein [Streptomyces sp. 8N114]|uniref:peptidase inhibitor family I36 protein n=1 Tax=Streptomyces sp. 8N114 TaxID=3457419 RepID=UPI003FD37961